MKQLNAHQFKDLYEDLGINLNDLGCVMLDTEALPKPAIYQHELDDIFYTAKNPDHFWIKGYVADENPHVTLLYGLLTPAFEQPDNIARVMEGWKMPDVTIKKVGFFTSTLPDEEYFCIVAHVEVTELLQEGKERLEFLPHINTFSKYEPHLTLAYIRKDEKLRDRVVSDFDKLFAGKVLVTNPELNLGSNK